MPIASADVLSAFGHSTDAAPSTESPNVHNLSSTLQNSPTPEVGGASNSDDPYLRPYEKSDAAPLGVVDVSQPAGEETEVSRPATAALPYPIHPACAAIPPMSDLEYRDLVKDIRSNGLVEPIVLHEGQLVDGRHRLRACLEAGIQPRTVEWAQRYAGSMDLIPWIWSVNAQRRNLTPAQRAAAYLLLNSVKDREEAARSQEDARRRGGAVMAERRRHDGGLLANSPVSPSQTNEREQPSTARQSSEVSESHSTGRRKDLAENANVSDHVAKNAMFIEKYRPDLVETVSQNRISEAEALKLSRSAAADAVAEAQSGPAAAPAPTLEKLIKKAVRAVEKVLASVPDEKKEAFKAEVASTVLKMV